MISFNSRFINLITIALMIYLAADRYQLYQQDNASKIADNQTSTSQPNSQEALISLKIDPYKRYEDYSLIEKIIYFFFKDKIDLYKSEN